MAKQKPKEYRNNTFERFQNHSIEYHFTEEELKIKSRELAAACHDKQNIENQKKEVMSEFKNKLDGKINEIDILSNHVSQGYHYTTVKCRVLFHPDECKKEFYYDGKLYETTKMTDLDFQVKLEMREDEETETKDLF